MPLSPPLLHRWAVLACGGLLLLFAASCPGGDSWKRRPVILVTIDTLRADHVGLWSEGEAVTPALDSVGLEGAWARRAVAPFGRTTQSVGAILTGLHPLRHGADGLGMVLPEGVETLAERFRGAGYATGAFISNVSLRQGLGFEQGFEVFSNSRSRWKGDSAPDLTREALAWLDRVPTDQPFFLWVHYLDPHWPYTPEEPLARQADPDWSGPFQLFEKVERRVWTKGQVIFDGGNLLTPREQEHARRLYRAEVTGTDRAFGELLGGLEQRGLDRETVLLLTADHGESLGEHEYYYAHGETLYEQTLRVPFAVRAPGQIPPGTSVEGLVLLEDVAPTLLDLAGFGADHVDSDGRDLAPLLRGGGAVRIEEREQVHLTDHNLVHPENPRQPIPGRAGRWWSLRSGGFKLIVIPLGEGREQIELYDLKADPAEADNLAQREPQRVEEMKRRLAAWRARLPEGGGETDEKDAEELDALRGLGYIN